MSMTTTQSNPQDHSVSPKGMLIGGQWVESASSARIAVENPAKRKPVAEVPRGNAADVDRAVAAATKAYADWRKVPPGWQRDPGSAPPTQQAAVKAARDRWDHLPRPVRAAYP